ncbi:MAG: glutamine--fructose-6-phosphate transaminase (isomerizing) [Candidatus Azotimanducaceae bacterium]|uniref:Glutamine--fructose-6-phosphate aminotransferase [isomerizing] n=1 Tax=OM182 bacterium TaxID=2510334 RepID=A0A520S5G3_9GAMM|nr:MAG: glutamine--fructose-6-phosphate transaminase (isomerizing) [OM182 bacterium]
MCGIVAAVTKRNVADILLEGLQRLKYRGYDSAGLCVIDQESGTLQRTRRLGDVDELAKACNEGHDGVIGIGHTRWATHGKPSEANAHPHVSQNRIGLVHNGIIENHDALRKDLSNNYVFESDTDSEVLAHLLDREISAEGNFKDGVFKALAQVQGAYAITVIHVDYPSTLLAARVGSPLVIGIGIGENFVASDPQALRPVTDRFIYLEEGEVVEVTSNDISIFGIDREVIDRRSIELDDVQDAGASKGDFRHFMLKEIYDQPEAVRQTLEGRLQDDNVLIQSFGIDAETIFKKVKAIQIVACGSSYYAGMVAKYWFEEIVGLPCSVEIASEFRYRKTAVLPNTLLVTISQSGETADTLAAQRSATDKNYLASLCICNVPNSTMVRESDLSFLINAGTEVCVASTKAFTTQLTDLLMLVLALGHYNAVDRVTQKDIVETLRELPEVLEQALLLNTHIQNMAEKFVEKQHALFLGRGIHYPIALEGALKLKEISYIHAEAYPAGELKHGPLALVDNAMPVIAVAPGDELLEKLKSNLEEVKARGGELFVVGDRQIIGEDDTHSIRMPLCKNIISPIVYALPMQLVAYHVAVFKGTDVDQPRNLAKSVTVE